MSQNKIKSRSATVFLKKDSALDSIKLIEGIGEKRTHTLNGKVVDIKNMSMNEIIQTEVTGVNGWHRFNDAFAQVFTNGERIFDFPNGNEDIFKVLDDTFGIAKKAMGEVFEMEMRPIDIGDVIQISEWGFDGIAVSLRHFVVTDVDFEEFKRATGEFL
jgi:hypothetical protein